MDVNYRIQPTEKILDLKCITQTLLFQKYIDPETLQIRNKISNVLLYFLKHSFYFFAYT